MDTPGTPQPIWTPTREFAAASVIADYQRWLATHRDLRFDGYDPLWRWSVEHPAAFWQSIWDYFDLHSDAPITSVLRDARMPGARWFEGARLNYAQQVFRHSRAQQPAIRYAGEAVPLAELSWAQLQRQVASVAAALRAMGVGPGDRVAAYLPNVPQTPTPSRRPRRRRRRRPILSRASSAPWPAFRPPRRSGPGSSTR